MRRLFETSELVLLAAVVAMVDYVMSIHVVLAHIGASSAPILALYATKTAVMAKSLAAAALLTAYLPVKLHAQKSPRFDKFARAALWAYITFTYATLIALAFALETLSVPPTISQIPQ